MISYTLAVLSIVAVVSSRETVRQMPAITNSLVNLGKMEVSFYLNHRPESQQEQPMAQTPSFYPKSEVVEESCPCSAQRNAKDSLFPNPTNLFNKLLTSNDLFTFNKDSMSSSLCCESHEHVQEGTFVFEVPSNQQLSPNPTSSSNNFMPYLFDALLPNFPRFPISSPNKQMTPMKTKSIEILVLPNKNDNKFTDAPKFTAEKEKSVKEDFKNINIVGDREWPNYNIEHFKPQSPPSIKKDLNAQEKNKNDKEDLAKMEDKSLNESVNKTNSL